MDKVYICLIISGTTTISNWQFSFLTRFQNMVTHLYMCLTKCRLLAYKDFYINASIFYMAFCNLLFYLICFYYSSS